MNNAISTNPPLSASDLLRQLDDIKGLHPITAWPLAPGWWGLFAVCTIFFATAITLYLRRRAWHLSWKKDAAQRLWGMEEKLDTTNAQAIVADLSIILRCVAMRKFSRIECAGLQGNQWLQWLEENDPHHFNWSQAGRLLIDAPYAPPNADLKPDEVRKLIRAAGKWVK